VKSFVLAAWSSCGGPWRSVASELAVALTTTPRSPSSNAWPARPRHATSRHKMSPTSLRALRRVPSGVAVCADQPEPYPTAPGGSVFTIDTGSVFVIGPRGKYSSFASNCRRNYRRGFRVPNGRLSNVSPSRRTGAGLSSLRAPAGSPSSIQRRVRSSRSGRPMMT
jgi:hypothetical protein